MKKLYKESVDDHLPKWLHSRFLSAVHFIWEVKGDTEESIRRVRNVDESGQFTDEEMSWIMMLLTIPKLQTIIESSDDFNNFKAMKKASVH
jgi:hypothetical protein|tara:strand:- start:471 stop:743 length:273 start_codon:yes stop_codon:yes gene_type:complete